MNDPADSLAKERRIMTGEHDPADTKVAAVRRFNRFYTRQIGVLSESLLHSDFSLTEARILYELAHHRDLTASGIGRELGLDAGYLSRLLKKFVRKGYLRRVASRSDARQSRLRLTAAGRRAFQSLDRSSADEVASLLQTLPARGQAGLVSSMEHIQRLLSADPTEQPGVSLRSLRPGDIGWVTHRQAILYNEEYGWDETFEALVAGILGTFVTNFNELTDRAWIAERNAEIIGSIFAVRESDDTARLRLLYVEPSARGLGIGRRLVDECIAFARARGFRTLTLWTNDVLAAARHLYEATGFTLVAEEAHRSFGKDLVGQHWSRPLQSSR
jgi:DNA-binding MarR family transcriptional regulator/GNAT superfamily N-acetyltransferase